MSSSQLYLTPQHPVHLISIPSLSVINLLSLSSMTAALCWLVLVRSFSVSYASLLFPAFIPFSMASNRSPQSNSLWLISYSSWPRCAMLVMLLASSSGSLTPSVRVYRRIMSKLSFIIIQIWISLFPPGTSSTVTSSPYLVSLAIASHLQSIRLRAANFLPI